VTSQMLADPADAVYLLPARTRYEQKDGGTETSTERRVIFSPYIPGHDVGEARSEWEMLLDFAKAVRPDGFEKLSLDSGAAIRADIVRAIPSYAGIEKMSSQGDQFQVGGPMLCRDRSFPTPDGKAHFQPVRPPSMAADSRVTAPAIATGATRRFILATRRGKQFNSMVQRMVDPLTGAERDHILVSPQDAAQLRLRTGDPILLRSDAGEFRGRAYIAEVAPGTLQGHWPEVSVLISPGVVDPYGGVPDYNAIVTLER